MSDCHLERNNQMSFMRGGDVGKADGRDGTLQRKTMKRPLGNESEALPVPITGRKEGHGNSDPDQPGEARAGEKLWGTEVHVCVSSPYIIYQFYSFSLR